MSAPESGGARCSDELHRLRSEIEETDRALVRLIARRVEMARRVGAVKHDAGLPPLDPAREAAVIRRVGEIAREEGVSEEAIRELFWHVIAMSRSVQLPGA